MNHHSVASKATSIRLGLADNWRMQSSARVNQEGKVISTPNFQPNGWYTVSIPATVIAGLLQNGVYEDTFFGRNLASINHDDFAVPWWYRKEFILPAGETGRKIWLNFQGLNYRANIWLNGVQIARADEVVGPFRQYEFDITNLVKSDEQMNALALEVFRPQPDDLAITFVDWNPPPPDGNMGILNDVFVATSGPVTVRHPLVITNLDLPSLDMAHLTVVACVRNGTGDDIVGTLMGAIGDITFLQEVQLGAGEMRTVTFAGADYPQLNVAHPRIWWPWQWGAQELYDLTLAFQIGDHISDVLTTRFGVRQVTSELDSGQRIFSVNGQRMLIRGAAWSPDLFQRRSPERQEAEFRYARDLNLNAIRLEGKFEDDHFFDLADEYGILVIAGWCCCDAWEKPESWDAEKHMVANESLRSQILRLRHHPSMLAWMNGSDNPPALPSVERAYLAILAELQWPNPILSSATGKVSTVSGETGVKMLGPYEWVPPIYWTTDAQKKYGGAWGFATEICPGPAIPPLASLQMMLPSEHLWPIDDYWNYHCGRGKFSNLNIFSKALAARYGNSTSVEDYAEKAQVMAYEAHRAMFEAYGRNKYQASGVIQWMLNNAWPGMIWHLYDYYLRPGGAYFGAKKALEPVHIQYSYDDQTVVVVNSTLKAYSGLEASADLYNLDGVLQYHHSVPLTIPADAVVRAFAIPALPNLTTTYFLRLTLRDMVGQVVSLNTYWLSTVPDVLDWDRSEWYYTPVSSYADFTALQSLPPVDLTLAERTQARGAENYHCITVTNPSPVVAFAVHLKIKKGASNEELVPILWEDNYFVLLPGESRKVTARYFVADLGNAIPVVEVDTWNSIIR